MSMKDYRACAAVRLRFTVRADRNSAAIREAQTELRLMLDKFQDQMEGSGLDVQFDENAVITFVEKGTPAGD